MSLMGGPDILIVIIVIAMLFGGKRIPAFSKSLGEGLREFKKACNSTNTNEEQMDAHSSSKPNAE